MGLYNVLFGRNPSAPVLLAMLGTSMDRVPRFRDCFIVDDTICIHTRTGGGNRDDYQEGNDYLTTLPGYLRDADDDFDSTYADFYFAVPEKFKEALESLRSEPGAERNPAQMWQELFAKLDGGDKNDPQVKQALEACAPIMEQVAAAFKA
jgi:hypothetical protein